MKDKELMELITSSFTTSKQEEKKVKALTLKLFTKYSEYLSKKVLAGDKAFVNTGAENTHAEYSDLVYNVFNMLLRREGVVTIYEMRHSKVVKELVGYLEKETSEEDIEFLREHSITSVLALRQLLKYCQEQQLSVAL